MLLRRKRTGRTPAQSREHRAYKSAVAAADIAELVFARVGDVLPDPPTKTTDQFAYHDAVAWFEKADPGELDVNGGALLRRPGPKGWLLVQVFLKLHPSEEGLEIAQDDRGQIRGRRLIARRLDGELEQVFADTDLIIFR